ncbi:MAG: hypothetical protein IME94_01010 [Proteobacteria bacterium]|nr:hypothetical protein [Pseudomonadota bacterium]
MNLVRIGGTSKNLRSTYLIVLFFFCLSCPVFSSDFNINIRKTDINDLKDQIISPIDKNITFLKDLQFCLQNNKAIDLCVDSYAVKLNQTYSSEKLNSEDVTLKKEAIKKDLKNKLSDADRSDMLEKLKNLITEIEAIKTCITKAKTANEIKDCAVKYK